MSETLPIRAGQTPTEDTGHVSLSPSNSANSKCCDPSTKIRYRCKVVDEYDGIQGWTTVGLVFLTNFLVLGFLKSLGVLTKILNKEFGSTMHVYVLMCITYSLNCAAGPLACYLTRRYSARSIALIGTSMVTLGLITSWFATSLMFLYFSIGVLVGLGSGLTYPTGVILVGHYFVGTDNAGLANALIVTGSPIGGMVLPFFSSALCEIYTSRGAFLIVGGVMLHAIICVRAYSPPPRDFLRSHRKTSDDSNTTTAPLPSKAQAEECLGDDTCVICNECQRSSSQAPCDPDEGGQEISGNLGMPPGTDSGLKESDSTEILKLYERRKRGSGTSMISTCSKPAVCSSTAKSVFLQGTGQQIEDDLTDSKLSKGDQPDNVFLHQFGNARCRKCKEKSRLVISLHGLDCYKRDNTDPWAAESKVAVMDGAVDHNHLRRGAHHQTVATATLGSSASPPYILALDHSCVILCSETDLLKSDYHGSPCKDTTKHPEVIRDGVDRNGNSLLMNPEDFSSQTGSTSRAHSCMHRFRRWLSESPLRDPVYAFLLLSNCSTAICSTNIHLMISQLVPDSEEGYNKSSVVYLVISFADLVGRLLGAFLSDKGWLSPSTIYAIGLIFSGVGSSVLATLTGFVELCAVSLTYGIFSGFQVGIYGFLLTDIVGREKIHVGYGISMFLNGSIQFFSILVIGGTISRYRDGFSWIAPLLGCTLVAGGILWVCGITFCRRCHHKRSF